MSTSGKNELSQQKKQDEQRQVQTVTEKILAVDLLESPIDWHLAVVSRSEDLLVLPFTLDDVSAHGEMPGLVKNDEGDGISNQQQSAGQNGLEQYVHMGSAIIQYISESEQLSM